MLVELVVPAYNEAGNLERTVEQAVEVLRQEATEWEFGVRLMISAGSTDDTPSIADGLAERFPEVRVVHRTENFGFGNAIRDGLTGSNADVVIPFMADLSDDPADVPKLVAAIRDGYDVAYGSRFVPGGSVDGYPPLKLVYNRAFNNAVRLLFGVRARDVTNAFTAYRQEVIEELDPSSLRAEGFDITAELPLKAHILGFSSTEVPVSWRGREAGVSKLDATAKGPDYVTRVLEMFVVGNLLSLRDLFGAIVDQSWLRAVAAALIGLVVLVGLFSLAGFGEVFGIVAEASPAFVAASMASYLASFVFRTWRWRVLLRATGDLASRGGVFRALLFGWFLNFILPARIGDLGRGLALKTTERVPFSVGTGTVVIERALDMAVLGGAMLLLVTTQLGQTGSGIVLAAGAFGIAAALTTALVVVAVLPESVERRVGAVSSRAAAGLSTLSDALNRVASNPAGVTLAGLISVPVWTFETGTILLSARAIGLALPTTQALVAAITAFVAQAVPLTPAGLGTYETTIAATLSLYGIPTETGTALALVDHFGRIAVVTVLGAICTVHVGFRSRTYFRNSAEANEPIETDGASESSGSNG